MKSRSVVAVSAATLLAAGVISASTATASRSPHANKEPAFELTARATGSTFLDLNKKGNQGDTFSFTENLFFKGQGQVGHDFGACTVINKHASQCVITLTFPALATKAQGPDSSLTVQGISDDRDSSEDFAVTGGTGGFEGLNGEVDAISTPNKTILEFDFINPLTKAKVFG
jgi:hypothetical protein